MNAKIRQLRREAAIAGDYIMIAICDTALDVEADESLREEARRVCVEVIERAQAMDPVRMTDNRGDDR